MKVAIAESLGVHRNAFENFMVKAYGPPIGRRLEPSSAETSQQAAGDLMAAVFAKQQAAGDAAASEIIGIGYLVAAGSAERETEIQTRLNNMGGSSSRVRASLTDILVRKGVRLLA